MRRVLRVSPTGATCGVAVARVGARALTLVVIPKMWTSGPAHVQVEWSAGQDRLTLVMGELDTLEVLGGPEELAVVDAYLERQGAISDRPLVAPIGVSKLPVRATEALGSAEEAIIALDRLCQVAGQGKLGSAVPEAWGAISTSPVLRPLLLRDFVDEVACLVHLARRGYNWSEEVLPAIRGRVDATSIAIQQSTHWPSLRCRFEDFDRNTPLLQAIATALTVSATERTSNRLWAAMQHTTRELSILLRHQLSDVRDLSRDQALAVSQTIRLGTYDTAWGRSISLAGHVLQPLDGVGSQPNQISAIDLSIDTSRVWERILFQVLAMTQVSELIDVNGPGDNPLVIERPWSELGCSGAPPRPDLLARDGQGWWIIDAKYKRLSGGFPDLDDQYQLFAYSHLATAPDVMRLALLYPHSSEGSFAAGPFTRAMDDSSHLWVKSVAFPSQDDLTGSWGVFLERASVQLGEAMLSVSG